MTLHGRQQLPQHKNLYVRGLRPVEVVALFVCAVVSRIRAMATFPRAHTQSVSRLSAAKCCLLLLHGAQALLLPAPLLALAAVCPSPPSAVQLPGFPARQAKITVFLPPKSLLLCLLQPAPCVHPPAGSHN